MAAIFATAPGYKICLASASSRRRELLGAAGVDFFSLSTDCPERPPKTGESPKAYALATAGAKASEARLLLGAMPDFQAAGTAIIACDTIVCVAGQIFGKPNSRQHLLDVLNYLNGRKHQVFTGVCIMGPAGKDCDFVEETAVHFARWPANVLEAYADACKPYDKAGGYGIQDGGGFLVSQIEGSWTNVVGLPLSRLLLALLDWGIICARKGSQPDELL